jgi:hypothetical protein
MILMPSFSLRIPRWFCNRDRCSTGFDVDSVDSDVAYNPRKKFIIMKHNIVYISSDQMTVLQKLMQKTRTLHGLQFDTVIDTYCQK